MLLTIWWALVFLVGVVVGSGLNVFIFRLSAGKSAVWPSSHCFRCFAAIKWYDNLPIFGYLILRGRCRACGSPYSARYLWTELLVGVLFASMFYLEVLAGVFPDRTFGDLEYIWIGGIPLEAWLLLLFHAIWMWFAWVALGCARLTGRIPASLGLTALPIALAFAFVFPWPWPTEVYPSDWLRWREGAQSPPWIGLQLLPVWLLPSREWLGPLTFLAGTGLAWLALRLMRRPAGDAAYGMSVGGLFGWQFVGIALIIAKILERRTNSFAVALPVAVIGVFFAWVAIGLL